MKLGSPQSTKWTSHEFYKSAVVLGLDIGIDGIGVWLRKGGKPVWARTYQTTLPEAAPLLGRRLKRSARRSRQSRKHREFLLRKFCEKFGLPWSDINSNPFKLRLRALTSKLASKQALVVCLRHIIRHRGYDYHQIGNEDGAFPWGDEPDFKQALSWAESTCCRPDVADTLKYLLADVGWSEDKMQKFQDALSRAQARYNADPIRTTIQAHFAEKPHVRPPARKHNFPRELVWDHLKLICERHPEHFGGPGRLADALPELEKILNYHRKKPGALAERKVKRCPYTALYAGKSQLCCANSSPWVRRFKLLEFLASRTFVADSGARQIVNRQTFDWLVNLLGQDVEAIKAKGTRPPTKNLRKEFAQIAGCKLAPDKTSHNKDYFDQLRDLLTPRMTELKTRSSMCEESAEFLYKTALKDGFSQESVRVRLQDYYRLRVDAALGFGLYPQVEFLLGRRSKTGKQAVPGKLRQIFSRPEVQEALDGQAAPDYVVVECVRDMPRNLEQRREIQQEQKARRDFKDELSAKYELPDTANAADRKKVLLYDQQGGICPYTGAELVHPLAKGLQIDHIFPRERGGISELMNLVLTTGKTNGLKGKRTPWEARVDFPQALELAGRMRWNKAKRELFNRQEDECPEWQNLTRVAQLARQLRDEVAHWLGVKGDPREIARRIGTPSGFFTSVCRDSWKDGVPKKDRGNLRHHIWDAAVLSHIPPGPGLNQVTYGGIFYYERTDRPGEIPLQALPGLGPDVKAFDKQAAAQCLVEKVRPRKSKQPRTEETIYGKDGAGKLWVRKSLLDSAGVPIRDAERRLAEAGIPTEPKNLLPTAKLEKWLSGTNGEVLRLANRTRVERVPMIGSTESPTSLVPHRDRAGKIIGYKTSTEGYLRCEIWVAPGKDKKGRPIYQRRLIPHPRGLAGLQKSGLLWKKKQGDEPSLRQQVCGALAPYSKKIGSFEKGELFRLPLDANGNICLIPKEVFCWLWYRVESLRTNGQIQFGLAEFKEQKATPLSDVKEDITMRQPKDADVLAHILQVQDKQS